MHIYLSIHPYIYIYIYYISLYRYKDASRPCLLEPRQTCIQCERLLRNRILIELH